jgi:hypothetical protein
MTKSSIRDEPEISLEWAREGALGPILRYVGKWEPDHLVRGGAVLRIRVGSLGCTAAKERLSTMTA